MTTQFTTNLGLPNPQTGDPASDGTWGILENTARDILDAVTQGTNTINVGGSSNFVLTFTQGAVDETDAAHFILTGVLTGNIVVLWPNGRSRQFSVQNSTTGDFTLAVGVDSGAGTPAGTTVTIPRGVSYLLKDNGTDVALRLTSSPTPIWTIGGLFPSGIDANLFVSPGSAIDTVSGSNWQLVLSAKTRRLWNTSFVSGGASGTGCGNAAQVPFTTGDILSVWLIRNPLSTVTDVFVSLELTGTTLPTFPAGYTQARRIGSMIANYNTHMGSDLLLIDLPGGLTHDIYNDTTNYSGTPLASTSVSASVQADAWILQGTIKASGGASSVLVVNGDIAFGSIPQPNLAGNPGFSGYSPLASQTSPFQVTVASPLSKANPIVTIRTNTTGTTLSLWTVGWYDSREQTVAV